MFGQSLLSAFGSAACTTDDSNYPIANIAYYKMSDAGDSATHAEFATWDPNLVPTPNLSNGNLRMYGSGGSIANGIGYSNQSVSSGKHYWEHTVTAIGGESSFGIARPSDTGGSHYVVGTTSTSWGLYVNGNIYHNGVNLGAYMSGGFSNGDIIGAELDLDNGTLEFYKNGTGYGNAFTGLTGTFLVAAEWRSSGGANDHITNFGASSWAYNPSTGFVGVSELASYNGTATNVNFNTEGKFGFAGAFNGSSSYINLPNTVIPNQVQKTISLWVYPNVHTTEQGAAIILAVYDQISVYYNTSNQFEIVGGRQSNNAYINFSNVSKSPNQWYHIAISKTNSNISLYIDGILVETISYDGTLKVQNYFNRIGTNNTSSPFKFTWNGKVEQIRIYDSALSAANVTTLYNEIECPAVAVTNAFNTVLYTGDATARSITTVGFKPDFVWMKNRNSTQWHGLYDSVRGAGKWITSNATNAEADTAGTTLTSFNTDGFSLGNDSNGYGANTNNNTYVAWNWKAGGSVTPNNNTNGNVITTVSANVDAGFSIVKYFGGNISNTYGHGLSSAPELIIIKNLDIVRDWSVVGTALGGDGGDRLVLNDTVAKITTTGLSGTTATTFAFEHNNSIANSANNFIAYCFHSVAGYSKIGSYTGTGASGNVQYLGFEPAFVMVKPSSLADNWLIYDNKRGDDIALFANLSNADTTYAGRLELNSNGFTLNTTNSGWNGSGQTYIFLAIA